MFKWNDSMVDISSSLCIAKVMYIAPTFLTQPSTEPVGFLKIPYESNLANLSISYYKKSIVLQVLRSMRSSSRSNFGLVPIEKPSVQLMALKWSQRKSKEEAHYSFAREPEGQVEK